MEPNFFKGLMFAFAITAPIYIALYAIVRYFF